MANALKDRFSGVYDERLAQRVTPPFAPGPRFGTRIADVKTIVIHETAGWPARARASEFTARYLGTATRAIGEGPQFNVSGDGTVARLIGERLLTWHATFVNRHALGIENGHRDDRNPAGSTRTGFENWQPLGPGDRDDLPGQRFYALRYRFDNPLEVVFCWFPTASFAGPKGSSTTETGMLFPESQYRSLAALARYLSEMALVPRNFPLLPWARRQEEMSSPVEAGDSPRFRAIALADERFEPLLARLATLGFTEPMFQRADLAAFRTQYNLARIAANSLPAIPAFGLARNSNKALNRAWLQLFHEFRGFHGHGFAGSITHHDDHTFCPGPLFDWHRFAREVWDWWWYPFDFNDAFTAAATARRGYAPSPGVDTPLIEYFFENTPTDGRPDPYATRAAPPNGPPAGLFGPGSTPSTFRLEEETPIYAMANGELVAARLLTTWTGISMSFTLVRHEVYHEPVLGGAGSQVPAPPVLPAPPAVPAMPGRIDYDAPPTTVYSLYMHLGGTDRMNFSEVAAGNPDWLNRVLIRKKECDLAIDAAGQLHPVLQGMPAAMFTHPEPPAANRPTPLELLRMDKERLGTFLAALQAGQVATAPMFRHLLDPAGPTPINVLLGDFLGRAGMVRITAGESMHGICVQVFSRDLISRSFTDVPGQSSWNPPSGIVRPALSYQSEWFRTLTADEQAAVQAAGADPDLVPWWIKAAGDQLWDVRVRAAAKLSWDGRMYHYAPLDFLRWLNGVTWTSEWPKYQINDASGTLLPAPARPRPRRVS